eukprot:GSChrysophyteH1.ASY1.ANO1.2928.1 assembled CDS
MGCTLSYSTSAIKNEENNENNKQVQAQLMEEWKSTYSSSVRSTFVARKTTDIDDDFCILYDTALGKGGCGIVYPGESFSNDQLYAIKVCEKSKNDKSRLEREILLLKDVDHCNIVRLFSVYTSDTTINLVMEMCQGGHLGTLIQNQENYNHNKGRHLDEEWAKLLCRQLLSAVRHIHERGICHRDIKLQNILLDLGSNRRSQIKLIDFGYGSRFIGCCPMKTHCGTPYTTAPEVLRKSYDERCDLWSVGVAGQTTLTTNILAGRYAFSPNHWAHVGDEAKAFVKTLLEPNYKNRVHAAEAMEIPWIKNRTDNDPIHDNNISGFTTIADNPGVVEALGNIMRNQSHGQASLRRSGNMAIAFGLHDARTHQMRNFFQTIDTDSSGSLSREEFIDAIDLIWPERLENGITHDDCQIIFDSMDINNDDQVTFTEFLAATLNPEMLDIEALSEAFELLDGNGDGFISMDELKRIYDFKFMKNKNKNGASVKAPTVSAPQDDDAETAVDAGDYEDARKLELASSLNLSAVVGVDTSLEEQVMAVIASCDTDQDGRISHEEFICAMTGITYSLRRSGSDNGPAGNSGRGNNNEEENRLASPYIHGSSPNYALETLGTEVSQESKKDTSSILRRLKGLVDTISAEASRSDVPSLCDDHSANFSNLSRMESSKCLNPRAVAPISE